MSDSGSQSPEPDEEEYDYESLPQQFKDILNHSLRSSCVSGYEVWVSSLLTKGADVNAYAANDNSKTTALHIAIQNFRSNLVQLFIPKISEENKERAIAITTERLQSLIRINELLGGPKSEVSVQPAAEKTPSPNTTQPGNTDAQIVELRKAHEVSKKALEDHSKAALKKDADTKSSIDALTKELETERAARKVAEHKIHEITAELSDKTAQVNAMDEKLQAGAKERQTLKNKIRLASVTPGTPQPPQFASHPNFTFKEGNKRSVSMIESAPSTPSRDAAAKSPGPVKHETKDDMDLEEPVKSRVRRLVTRWESLKDFEDAIAMAGSGKANSESLKPSSPKASSESPRAHP